MNSCNFTKLIKYISITNNIDNSYKYNNIYINTPICIRVFIQYRLLFIVLPSVLSF